MEKWSDLEGTEIVYVDPRKFDMFGTGTVKGIETRKDLPMPMVEIVFPDSLTVSRQFLPVKVFMERIEQKEIEITTDENFAWHQWRARERGLVNQSLYEAAKEIRSLSSFELSILLELLKKRVEGETRLKKEEAILLLGELGEFEFLLKQTLLEQTKKESKKRGASPQIPSSLRAKARFQQEQHRIISICLTTAAYVAKNRDAETILLVREAALKLQHSSVVKIKKTAKAVLKSLQ